MGNCCSADQKKNKDINLSKFNEHISQSALSMKMVIRMQAIARGFIARKKVKNVYGYQMTKGLLHRGDIDIDPEVLEEQRKRVLMIREKLPPFQYDQID